VQIDCQQMLISQRLELYERRIGDQTRGMRESFRRAPQSRAAGHRVAHDVKGRGSDMTGHFETEVRIPRRLDRGNPQTRHLLLRIAVIQDEQPVGVHANTPQQLIAIYASVLECADDGKNPSG
jgi:hypothetical protein